MISITLFFSTTYMTVTGLYFNLVMAGEAKQFDEQSCNKH